MPIGGVKPCQVAALQLLLVIHPRSDMIALVFPQSLEVRTTYPKEFEDRSSHGTCHPGALREGGFTLIELLVVMGIITLLMVLIAPAFTNMKSAGDVTSAAYGIKGVLDKARTYAMENNTYVSLVLQR